MHTPTNSDRIILLLKSILRPRFKKASINNRMQHSDVEAAVSVAIGVILLLITLIGGPINVYALNFLAKHAGSPMRFLHRIQISLCIGNLVQMLPLYLMTAASSFKGQWLYGSIGCDISAFWVHFTALSSIWHLVLYAAVQYNKVCGKFALPGHDVSRFKQYAILSFIWITGIIWSAFPFLGWATYQLEGLKISCSISWENSDTISISYNSTIFCTNFLAPVIILIYCYRKIFVTFKEHINSTACEMNEDRNNRNITLLRQTARTGCVMTFAFLFIWAPYTVVAMITVITGRPVSPIAGSLPAVLAKCSCIIIPVVILWQRKRLTTRVANAPIQPFVA